MTEESQTARVVGTSMEPSLFEGDLLEVSPCPLERAEPGRIYGFSLPGLDRLGSHRLLKIEEKLFFQGDRQPFGEEVDPQALLEVRRVLDRKKAPAAPRLMFGLLGLIDREPVQFPRNSTLHWPWENLIALGQKHKTNPVLFYVLKRHGLWKLIPDEARESLRLAWMEAAGREPLLQKTMEEVERLLPYGRPLKGAKLRDLYPDRSIRTMEDVDFLVPAERFEEAIGSLLANGFRISEESRRIAEFYSSVTIKHGDTGIPVDLHRAPFQPNRFRFRTESFFGDPGPEFVFCYLSAHAFQHWGRHGQCLLDLLLYSRRHVLDPGRLRKTAEENGAHPSVLFALRQLHQWFNHPLMEMEPPLPGIRMRLALAELIHAGRMEDSVFGKRKHLLQLLLSESLYAFWKLYRDPARRKMG